MKVLVTGGAGFIGFHLSKYLLDKEVEVIAIDNLNDYYDPQLKKDRLAILEIYDLFKFYKADIKEKESVDEIFENERPTHVINLAAQAGVRYSLENPLAYVDSNLVGFVNILEACRHYPVEHLLYASSSSVYGGNKKVPFSTDDRVDHPVSLYAATKKSNELMAHAYSHLYNIPTTGLRFFTVYGPFGRPDMAYYSFTQDILAGRAIKVFNHGKMKRDFTYIDEIVEAVSRLLNKVPKSDKSESEENGLNSTTAPYRVFNIGNNEPVTLMEFIEALEEAIGKNAEKIYMDMQPGDVKKTYADVSGLEKLINFKPKTKINKGLNNFIKWYREYTDYR